MAVTITVSSYVVEADGVVSKFVRHACKLQNYTTAHRYIAEESNSHFCLSYSC